MCTCCTVVYLRHEWHLTNKEFNILKYIILLLSFFLKTYTGRTTLLNFVLSIKKQTRPVPVNSDSLVERRNECTKKHFSSADQMIVNDRIQGRKETFFTKNHEF